MLNEKWRADYGGIYALVGGFNPKNSEFEPDPDISVIRIEDGKSSTDPTIDMTPQNKEIDVSKLKKVHKDYKEDFQAILKRNKLVDEKVMEIFEEVNIDLPSHLYPYGLTAFLAKLSEH